MPSFHHTSTILHPNSATSFLMVVAEETETALTVWPIVKKPVVCLSSSNNQININPSTFCFCMVYIPSVSSKLMVILQEFVLNWGVPCLVKHTKSMWSTLMVAQLACVLMPWLAKWVMKPSFIGTYFTDIYTWMQKVQLFMSPISGGFPWIFKNENIKVTCCSVWLELNSYMRSCFSMLHKFVFVN